MCPNLKLFGNGDGYIVFRIEVGFELNLIWNVTLSSNHLLELEFNLTPENMPTWLDSEFKLILELKTFPPGFQLESELVWSEKNSYDSWKVGKLRETLFGAFNNDCQLVSACFWATHLSEFVGK